MFLGLKFRVLFFSGLHTRGYIFVTIQLNSWTEIWDHILNYNMTVWILARKDINFSMAAGLIRLHMPGVK